MATPAEILAKMNEVQAEFSAYQELQMRRTTAISARDQAIARIATLDVDIGEKLVVLQALRVELKGLL